MGLETNLESLSSGRLGQSDSWPFATEFKNRRAFEELRRARVEPPFIKNGNLKEIA